MRPKRSRGRRRRKARDSAEVRSQARPRERGDLAIFVLLAVAVLAVWAGTLRNGFVGTDDNFYVYENPHVLSGLTGSSIAWAFSTMYFGWFHPITWLSHMADVQLFGVQPAGHHATSLLLHLVNTLLLYALLSRATGARSRSAIAAAIFALHPLRVESVAWISERKDLLAAFFGLLAIAAYARYASRSSRGAYAASLLLFGLSLASKSMLVTLPFLLLLIDWWPLERLSRSMARGLLLEKLPYLALAAAASVVTYVAQLNRRAMITVPFAVRLDNAVLSYVRYLGKLFYPARLSMLYPRATVTHGWLTAAAAAGLLAVTAACLALGRRHRYLASGWLWYLGGLVPVLGIVQVGRQSMADRYTYIPALGVTVIAVWGLADLTRGWSWRRGALGTVSAVSLALFAFLTVLQIRIWRDSTTLFEHSLAMTDNNSELEIALGRWNDAILHLEQTLRTQPNSPETLYSLGVALESTGRISEARERYLAALRLKPDYPEAHSNLGLLLMRQGKAAEALPHLAETLRLDPDAPQGRQDLADCLRALGRTEEASRLLLAGPR